jgi:hypothetical protein
VFSQLSFRSSRSSLVHVVNNVSSSVLIGEGITQVLNVRFRILIHTINPQIIVCYISTLYNAVVLFWLVI